MDLFGAVQVGRAGLYPIAEVLGKTDGAFGFLALSLCWRPGVSERKSMDLD